MPSLPSGRIPGCSAAALVVAGLALAACSEAKGPDRCATAVAVEVCDTPSNLRGAEPVQDAWTSAPAPELAGQPLAEGRYVLTARTHYCVEGGALPDFVRLTKRVVEVSGCVLRVTTQLLPDEETYVGVTTFNYAADGSLDETVECVGGERPKSGRRFGFDGTTLELGDASEFNGPPEPGRDCATIETLELR
jgi:hypothetical protein